MARTLIHLEVGNAEYTPTADELKKIIEDFIKEPIFTYATDTIYINTIELSDVRPYQFIISAGDPEWQPTQEELDGIKEMFNSASLDPKGGVVATRQGVQVRIHLKPYSEDNCSHII